MTGVNLTCAGIILKFRSEICRRADSRQEASIVVRPAFRHADAGQQQSPQVNRHTGLHGLQSSSSKPWVHDVLEGVEPTHPDFKSGPSNRLVSLGDAKNGEYAVASVLLDVTAVVEDDSHHRGDHAVEHVERLFQVVHIGTGSSRTEADEVEEHHTCPNAPARPNLYVVDCRRHSPRDDVVKAPVQAVDHGRESLKERVEVGPAPDRRQRSGRLAAAIPSPTAVEARATRTPQNFRWRTPAT